MTISFFGEPDEDEKRLNTDAMDYMMEHMADEMARKVDNEIMQEDVTPFTSVQVIPDEEWDEDLTC